MQQTLLILALVAVVVAVLWLLKRRPAPAASAHRSKRGVESLDTLTAWPPSPTRVLTIPECQAYNLIRRALPDHMILAQVPLQRFLRVPTRHSYAEWLRRAGQLSVDLVVCDPNSQVVAVVDIRQADGQESERAKKRQARMERVLQAAGIPVHVWREDRLPTLTVAREVLLESQLRSLTAEGDAIAAMQGAGRNQIDPPPSTWYDELDSAPVPLGPAPGSQRR